MREKRAPGTVATDTPGRGYFWFLMLVGLVLVAYFSVNLAFNAVYAADNASNGVPVVWKDAVYDDSGQVVSGPEGVVLHGFSGWVEAFSPWLAMNAYILALGTLFFGLGYVMTRRREDGAAVSIFKVRMLGGYIALVSLLMLVFGVDRVYAVPHGHKGTVLAWTSWYVLEFLAHIVWAVVLGALSVFCMRVQRVDEAAAAGGGPEAGEKRGE